MTTDLKFELEWRARVHAALGEPARLAVVEALSLGDASPSELQALLGVPSNLLAHHLLVLEKAQVVTRSRSEGDHRRTYLKLVAGTLEGLLPDSLTTAPRVLFVCTHNSARSQLAVALWRRLSKVPVASAGTSPAPRVHAGMLAAAQRHGLPVQRARPRRLDDVVLDSDFVVTVCDSAHEQIGAHELIGAAARLHWSIPDPVRVGSDDAFDQTFDQLTRRIGDLAARVITAPQAG